MLVYFTALVAFASYALCADTQARSLYTFFGNTFSGCPGPGKIPGSPARGAIGECYKMNDGIKGLNIYDTSPPQRIKVWLCSTADCNPNYCAFSDQIDKPTRNYCAQYQNPEAWVQYHRVESMNVAVPPSRGGNGK